MKITIAIDAYRLEYVPNSSIALYIAELVKALTLNNQVEKIYLCVPLAPKNAEHFNFDSQKVEYIFPKRKYNPIRSYRYEFLWMQIGLLETIKKVKHDIDYFIFPYHQTSVLLSKKIKAITVIHDVCALDSFLYPRNKKGYYRHYSNFISSLFRSNLFIPISEFTKTEYLKHFPSASSRITEVVYNKISGVMTSDENMHSTLSSWNLAHHSYFFVIGSMDKRKSFDLIVEAYRKYRIEGGKGKIVMIVASHQVSDIQEVVDKNELPDVIIKSGITSAERDALYKGALALVFPSRCEGFGYPVLEAMVQGCPPIVWKHGPAFEIMESSAPFIENLNADSIKDFLFKYEAIDLQERRSLAEKMITRATEFLKMDFGKKFFKAMTKNEHNPYSEPVEKVSVKGIGISDAE